MEYESNPKHSEPWQAGRRGALCPKEVRPLAAELLSKSELFGGQRFAFYEGQSILRSRTSGRYLARLSCRLDGSACGTAEQMETRREHKEERH